MRRCEHAAGPRAGQGARPTSASGTRDRLKALRRVDTTAPRARKVRRRTRTMADDKKPKIDLKSRLQKMGGPGAATPRRPPRRGASPPSRAAARRGAPAPMPGAPVPPPSVPPPSGIPRPPIVAAPGPRSTRTTRSPPSRSRSSQRPGRARRMRSRSASRSTRSRCSRPAAARASRASSAASCSRSSSACSGYVGGGASQQGADRKKSAQTRTIWRATSQGQGHARRHEGQGHGRRQEPHRRPQVPAPTSASSSRRSYVDFAGDKLFGRRFAGVPGRHDARALRLHHARGGPQQQEGPRRRRCSTSSRSPSPRSCRAPRVSCPSRSWPSSTRTHRAARAARALVTPICPNDAAAGKSCTFVNPRGSGNVELPRLQGPEDPQGRRGHPHHPEVVRQGVPEPREGRRGAADVEHELAHRRHPGPEGQPGRTARTPKPGLSDEAAAKLADSLNKVN